MARELSCPQCPQVLTVPESLLGQTVKCPQCGGIFRTTSEGTIIKDETPTPAEPPVIAPEPTPPAATMPCPACHETIPSDSVRCPFCAEDARAPANSYDQGPGDYIRRDVLPHRGNIILLLGILSLVSIVFGVCCQPLSIVGIGLGSAAWLMANADLRKMHHGEMDPGGESNTNAGKICGIIGIILSCLYLLACGAYLAAVVGWQLWQDNMQNK